MKNVLGSSARRRTPIRSYQVFICYASSDTWVAQIIAENIESLDVRAWMATRYMAGGDRIFEEVLRAIGRSQEAVVLVSEASALSQWVNAEIGAFLGQHKRVTPILQNEEHLALSPILAGLKAVALDELDVFLAELERRLPRNRKGRV